VRKGLLECLMIKRAKLTVYNAQEADTFGKDAEAGVTLAQGKPVVVYVARLFGENEFFKPIYQAIDASARLSRNDFIELISKNGLLAEGDTKPLYSAEKTKGDVIKALIERRGSEAVGKIASREVAMELIRQGYDPPQETTKLSATTLDRVVRLERRALTFRDVHPLSIQASPIDGVARGVMVTRTIEDTAKTVANVLLGTVDYEIREDEENWLLLESLTKSPVRVVTKDPVLTTAFWSEQWGGWTQ